MKRIPLKPNTVIELTDFNGKRMEYKIIKVKSEGGEKGASCLCYVADKKDNLQTKRVLLKEFYPEEHLVDTQVRRVNNGFVEFEDENDIRLVKQMRKFQQGVERLHEFVNDKKLAPFVCCEKGIRILAGNGTFYCENCFYEPSFSWKDIPADTKLDEIIHTAIGIYRFLKHMHERGLAYVDLKPDDILIKQTPDGYIDYGKPLFFDFNNIMSFGKHLPEEINATPQYSPVNFFLASDKEVEIDKNTEHYTFAKVLESQCGTRKDSMSEDVRADFNRLIKRLKTKDGISEAEVEETLKYIRNRIRDHEYEHEQEKLLLKVRRYNIFHGLVLASTICVYILVSLMLGYLCINAGDVQGNVFSWGNGVSFVIILLILIAAITVMRLFNMKLAASIANKTIACKYYLTNVRTGEFNTFRLGNRRNTTYQDKGRSNQDRQKLRRGLWVILGLAILGGFGLSVHMNAFPICLTIGFPSLVIFMYADFLTARKWHYEYYAKTQNIIPGITSSKDGEALYYMREYVECPSPEKAFDENSEFYINQNLNVLKIRKTIINRCLKERDGEAHIRRRYFTRTYNQKTKYLNQCDWKHMDLEYEPNQIRQIYKMAFDRLQNNKLIGNFVVLAMTIMAVFASVMVYSDGLMDYFRLPKYVNLPFAIGSLLLVVIVSCVQVIYSKQEEMLIAEMAYKSRYIVESALNDELIKDIAIGFVMPIDIARGTHQYDGAVITKEQSAEKARIMHLSTLHNRPLFHHRIVGDRERLGLTVWLCFGALFSIFVWYMGCYILFPFLLIAAIVTHLILNKYLLPVLGKKSLIKRIQKLEKYL